MKQHCTREPKTTFNTAISFSNLILQKNICFTKDAGYTEIFFSTQAQPDKLNA
jgi:hypothetical protein